jgi:hypothetical protein
METDIERCADLPLLPAFETGIRKAGFSIIVS